ncbi:uncharacterized protein LOC103714657 isoform X2 [Phoenix dactylifera]|uniref:Uncharacterized protein LOC103714657 isoform X2 n=1 Tax=Phoenix dactylifera TaxID=42345 RepID=A0A8B7CJE6_PHODC|nr:uncharacterized protein LOC103714657 isoform X2 [Phoenix dactylifera]
MRFKKQESGEGEPSIQVNIMETADGGSNNLFYWGSTFFEPQKTPSNPTPAGRNGSQGSTIRAPEKKLTLFALRLAILEKAASGLGTLAFIWATVVLLGGFASMLEKRDFWSVTIILLIEGTRIFSRSHELEWQHEATWTLSEAGWNSFEAIKSSSRFIFRRIKAIFQLPSITKTDGDRCRRITGSNQTVTEFQNQVVQQMRRRTWYTPNVPLIPHAGWIFLLKNVSRILTWLQLLSATACVTLSLMRLIKQDYGEVGQDNETKNGKAALDIFYGLALAEALMFLLEKAYWNWKISYGKLLEDVSLECELGLSGIISIKRFFYDAYSKCINGSIFDGLKIELVTYSQELLDSDFPDEQIIGARILQKLVKSNQFASETLRKIGTSTWVIERLVDMLNWKNPTEEEIRRCAAEIVSKLAGKKQNALRVSGIPGAMESISSLLHTGRISNAKSHDVHRNSIIPDQADYDFSVFNLYGLLILKKLAHDHENCGKIGNARGLLPNIIDLTSTGQSLLRNDRAPESQIKAVKRSLQVVKMLVSTTGNTGKMLRQAISEIVFTVSNIRDILQYGESHLVLQKLAIEILQSLAMDENAREKIGSTGGIVKLLLLIFFRPGFTEDENELSNQAGEALAMLALESKKNCERILKVQQVLDCLVSMLNDPVLRINAFRILRNLCAYSATECSDRLKGVTAAMPTVLRAIMLEKDKLLEVSIGLTTQICKFMSSTKFAEELEQAGIKETDLIQKLIEILNKYNYPEIKVPRIRRNHIRARMLPCFLWKRRTEQAQQNSLLCCRYSTRVDNW